MRICIAGLGGVVATLEGALQLPMKHQLNMKSLSFAGRTYEPH